MCSYSEEISILYLTYFLDYLFLFKLPTQQFTKIDERKCVLRGESDSANALFAQFVHPRE